MLHQKFWMRMEIDFFDSFFNPSKRVFWVYILSSLAIATVYLTIFKKERRLNLSRKLWLHKSAVLDYKYYVLAIFIKAIIIIPLVFSAKEVTQFTYEVLLGNFGYIRIRSLSYSEVMVLFTLALFIVSDFTRYWLHRIMHIVPFLWEFHKVHHSARVLTPITFYRIHPVENLLFGFRYALSIGVVSGVFIYLFGAMIGIVEILGANILLFIFSLAGSNLRHSHIKIRYPKSVESFLISPYQHQIHHSNKYVNKNFGGYLAVWDRVFGTLIHSKNVKKFRTGIEVKNFQTINQILFTPFVKSYKKIIGKKYANKAQTRATPWYRSTFSRL